MGRTADLGSVSLNLHFLMGTSFTQWYTLRLVSRASFFFFFFAWHGTASIQVFPTIIMSVLLEDAISSSSKARIWLLNASIYCKEARRREVPRGSYRLLREAFQAESPPMPCHLPVSAAVALLA